MAALDMDSGRAWLIAFNTHVCVTIHEGLISGLGVMIPDITEYFDTATWIVGLIITLMPAIGSLISLTAGPLSERFSSRVIIMICGFIGASGLVLGALATDSIAGLGFVLITLTGVSLRMASVLSMSILGQSFTKYYAIANSLALLGVSSSTMLFPSFTQYLLTAYGWKGALLILGAISAHIMVCGAVMTEPVNDNGEHGVDEEEGMGEHGIYDILNGGDDTETILSINGEVNHECNERKPLTKNRSSNKTQEEASQLDPFGFKLLFNIKFILLLVVTFLDLTSCTGWNVYIVPFAQEKGLHAYKATSLTTAGGIGNVIGKIVLSPIMDGQFVPPRIMLATGFIISGTLLVMDPLFGDHRILMATSGLYGLVNGVTFLLIFVIVKEIVGSQSLPKALPWIFLVSGAGRMLAGFSVGWFYEVTGSYELSWLIIGCVSFLSAFCIGVELVVQKCDHCLDCSKCNLSS